MPVDILMATGILGTMVDEVSAIPARAKGDQEESDMKIDTMTLCRLTRREAEDLTTYSPTTSFVTPPIAQGQIVEVSYALDAHAEVIIERTEDRSEPMSSPERVVYRAYAFPEDGAWAWEPWNDVPELGADLGRCKIASSR